MSVPRTKPWEVSSGTSAASAGVNTTVDSTTATPPTASTTNATSTDTTNASSPSLPARPTSLTSTTPTAYGGGYGSMGGMGGMGSMGSMGSGYGSYGSYGGYGGYGSSMYGGYGSYSSPYSRYGGGMGYGMGGYGGMGMGGMGMMHNDPNSLQQSTAATFQLIESMVGAVGGFAQMLESTYMATHSSFFAMMSVAEQFGHLKNSLGSILGVFAIMRWIRKLVAKLSGRPMPASASSPGMSAAEFAKFSSGAGAKSKSPRPSFKPLLFFLAAVVGFPYLLGRLIKTLALNQENRVLEGPQAAGNNLDAPIDPSQLEFCRALHDFVPENTQIELELKKGDLVAILSKQDPMGNPSQWWRVRTRDGQTGYIPSTFVEIIPQRKQIEPQQEQPQQQPAVSNMVEEFKKV